MPARDTVITGFGLISPLGPNARENFSGLSSLRTGIRHFPLDGLPDFLQYLGRIDSFALPDVSQKLMGQMKFLNRGALLGFAAAHEAVLHSGVDLACVPRERRSLYIASGDFTKVGYDFLYPAMKDATNGAWKDVDAEKLNEATLNKVNPFFLLESLANNLFSFLSAYFECMGPSTSIASLSPCGGYAIELACRSIRQDRADIALAVGCGSWLTEIPLFELESFGLLSRCRDGVESFRPFDRNRDGFIPGEGGAVLVLESREHAEKRGAQILGSVLATANCLDYGRNDRLGLPDAVIERVVRTALDASGTDPSDIAFVSPHGSGTQKGDRSELASVANVEKSLGVSFPVSGMKAYTGHLGAASDVAEVILGLMALREGFVPATLHFREPDREYRSLRISGGHVPTDKGSFLSVSYGIAGQSSAVLIDKTR
ncbi:MAG: beta-ketoacyl-ACP synthase II [Thermodesulfovibrionales bacterium]